jgi:hypothetical protein
MRMDQFIGLNNWAKRKVRRTKLIREIGKEIRPSGKEVPFDRTVRVPVTQKSVYSKVRASYKLFAGDLHRYVLANGAVLEEYVQATIHSGGPCYFIALRDSSGEAVPESLWTDAELAKA